MTFRRKHTIIALLLPTASHSFTNVNVGSPLIRQRQQKQHQQQIFLLPSLVSTPTVSPSQTFRSNRNWQRYANGVTTNSESENDDDDEKNHNIMEADIIDKTTSKNKLAATKKDRSHIQGIHPLLLKTWQRIKNSIKKPSHRAASLMTAAFIMFAVLFTPISEASAARSGGRMGGSFGGSGRSSSRQSYSRSYSAPSRSYSSPSSSYNRGYSRGLSSGLYARPPIVVAPTIGNPYAQPSYYGPGGVAVIRRGPSIVDVFLFGVFAVVVFNVVSSVNDFTNDTSSTSALGPGVSVAQISVALNVPKKDSSSSILTFLSRLSRTARTDSRVGVSNLVSQVALELLRQRRSAFAASSKYTHYRDGDKAQRDYSALTIQERSKFERESISNYGGVDYSKDGTMKSPSLAGDTYLPQATAAVVTIILCIDGDSTKLPTINSVADLEQALTTIASDAKVDDCLRSAEVLWTPEDSDDTLSETDVIVDYPQLRTI